MNHVPNRRRFLASASALPLAVLPRPSVVSTVDRATGDRINALWDALQGTWGAEFRAAAACDAEHDRVRAMPEGEEADRAYEAIGGLLDAKMAAERPRRSAYSELCQAVLEAAGREAPPMVDWYRSGRPIATVRVGNRLFVVCVDSDADYNDDHGGLSEVCVIDL